MGQYWTRKNDQEDQDRNTFCPWTEVAMKEDRDVIWKRLEVVAAVIERDGLIFATQRGYGEWEGWWEFPGGKMERNEEPEAALRREIKEELDTEIEVGPLLTTIEYDYPKFHLTLHCYKCKILSGNLNLLEHEDARWLSKDQLDSVKWLPADETLIALLKKSSAIQ